MISVLQTVNDIKLNYVYKTLIKFHVYTNK